MTFALRPIGLALGISIALHLGALFAHLPQARPEPPPPALEARILPPPAPPPIAEVPRELPTPSEESVTPPPPLPLPKPAPQPAKPAPSVHWEDAVQKQLDRQDKGGMLYSRDAIAAGLEGTPVVLAVLDEEGNVTAARIEESSGHALLDRDALAAARRLRYLPAATPREVILPIRFRLRK